MVQDPSQQPKAIPQAKRRVLLSMRENESLEQFADRIKEALRKAGILKDRRPREGAG